MKKKIKIALIILVSLAILFIGIAFVYKSFRAGSTGLIVHLYTSQNEFKLGEPIVFSAVVINSNFNTVEKDLQGYGHNAFEITGPDGKEVEYVVGIRQTCGSPIPIKPLHGIIVRQDCDLCNEYAFKLKGKHRIRIRKYSDELKASNEITIEIKGGKSPIVDTVVSNINQVLPEKWKVGRCTYYFESITPPGRKDAKTIVIQITRGYTHKNRIDIYFTDSEAPEDLERPPKNEMSIDMSMFLGKGEHGYYYYHIWKETEKTWPTFISDLKSALKIVD